MIIIPAIDILDGMAVRLYKGDYNKKEKVAEDIIETAINFEKIGAKYIHIVDLNGAKIGEGTNHKKIIEVANTVNVPIEVGGGIRNIKTVEYLLNNGVSRVILGTAAVKDDNFLKEALKNFGEKIAVGIDFNNNLVCTDGWLKESNLNYIDFAKYLEKISVKNLIVTDISKDGTLKGANIEMLKELKKYIEIDITASGGVKDLNDIREINELNVYGTIVGKAIYEGTLSLKEAINLTK
ncbi:MAG: 1-(5-phosphoribosyl)-5-[(5-phosphoribosylamino)methylideneamino]imidazole-4-carboxamide isomerase [Sarcina sp.]